jgi:hypothetical protein
MTEPVAIRYNFDGYGYHYMDSGSGSDWLTRVNGEPLYTKPAELTDEEIKDIWSKTVCSVHITKAELDFARAILKKASEK